MKLQKTQRQLQVGEQVKRIIADALLKVDDLLFSRIYVTVLRADASPDLKNIKILLDIFGKIDPASKKDLTKKINDLAPYFKAIIAKQIKLRYTPEITFVVDDSFDKVGKIEDLIKQESKKFNS